MLCECRFRYLGKKIHVKCSTLRDKHQDACDTKTFGDRLTRNLTANEHKKPPTRYRIGGRKYIVSCALCADLQNADALDAAALALKRRMDI